MVFIYYFVSLNVKCNFYKKFKRFNFFVGINIFKFFVLFKILWVIGEFYKLCILFKYKKFLGKIYNLIKK